MRDVYRGKSAEDGEWIVGFYSDERGCETCFPAIQPLRGTHRPASWRVIPETVSRGAGMPDKNGKEIFTGDIVRINGSQELAYIAFEEFCFVFKMPAFNNWRHRLENNPAKYEVVGNIWDNPELLEVGYVEED